jgi:hypothetical protein
MVKNVSTQPERNTAQRLDARNLTSSPGAQEPDKDLSLTERELLQEVLRALRVIRYGSVVLTVHDGNVVEIQKIERIRKASGKQT